MAERFWDDFRRFFFRGLAAVLPTVLTVVILVWLFSMIQRYFGYYINIAGVELSTDFLAWRRGITDPDKISELRAEVLKNWNLYFFWFGFLLAVLGVYIFGRFVASFLGRTIWRITEKAISNLPIIKAIYPSVKQVTDFLLTERKMSYSKVVAVEYPRRGIWSLGLVTNSGMRTLRERVEDDLVTVFIPSSPTPVTGYTITVKREDVVDLPISIDEALRFTVSGGVIQPPHEWSGKVRLESTGPHGIMDQQKESDA